MLICNDVERHSNKSTQWNVPEADLKSDSFLSWRVLDVGLHNTTPSNAATKGARGRETEDKTMLEWGPSAPPL